jgi:hypothetical protein
MNGCPVFPEDQRLVKVIMLSGAVGEPQQEYIPMQFNLLTKLRQMSSLKN